MTEQSNIEGIGKDVSIEFEPYTCDPDPEAISARYAVMDAARAKPIKVERYDPKYQRNWDAPSDNGIWLSFDEFV